MSDGAWDENVIWELEAFREDDELINWSLPLPGADRVSLEGILGIEISTPGGYELNTGQVEDLLNRYCGEQVKWPRLDASKFSYFIAVYAK